MRLPRLGSRAARWRRAHRDTGETATILPLNLPEKARATRRQQARWVKRRLRRVDVATIAECSAGLADELRRIGLRVVAAPANLGGNGNVIVSRRCRLDALPPIRTPFVANSGARYTLSMASAVVTKQATRLTLDAVHAPSRGPFKTSADDAARFSVFSQIAQHDAPTAARAISGDTNWLPRQVQAAMRTATRSRQARSGAQWRHLGGVGVEHVLGVGLTPLGQRTVRYGRHSDHRRTAVVKVGMLNETTGR